MKKLLILYEVFSASLYILVEDCYVKQQVKLQKEFLYERKESFYCGFSWSAIGLWIVFYWLQ